MKTLKNHIYFINRSSNKLRNNESTLRKELKIILNDEKFKKEKIIENNELLALVNMEELYERLLYKSHL